MTLLIVGWALCSLAAVVWFLTNRAEMEVVGIREQYRTRQDLAIDLAVLVVGALGGPLTLLALTAIWWLGRRA